jgi:predicted RNase H-like HicB family nuclease
MQRYLIIIESTLTGFSAWAPDLPGCISTGSSVEQVEGNMRDAVAFHLDGLCADGHPVPQAHTIASYVEVAA